MTRTVRTAADAEIRRLHRERRRNRRVFWSGLALLLLSVYAWTSEEIRGSELRWERRRRNLERFLGEVRPAPLRSSPGSDVAAGPPLGGRGGVVQWAGEILASRGWEAARTTLALAAAAIVLAALGAWTLALPAARTVATAEAYLPGPRPPGGARRLFWRSLVAAVRLLLILLRSLPEYVWAFLFLAILGPTAWPVVLALALHNAGILGKLAAEVVENLDPAPLAALRGLGAGRSQIAVAGIFPLALPRFLLFFFYRWETCVRETTVLGMLGVSSLGYWVVDARARQNYDEMVFFVLIGAAIVLAGDLVSALARELVRRAA
jgi:phosphonate transport system permease protein